jgi:hypothetical protein
MGFGNDGRFPRVTRKADDDDHHENTLSGGPFGRPEAKRGRFAYIKIRRRNILDWIAMS